MWGHSSHDENLVALCSIIIACWVPEKFMILLPVAMGSRIMKRKNGNGKQWEAES